MRIYTAATFSEQKRIRAMKESLVQLGHNVLSTWLEETVKPDGMGERDFERKMAMKDLQEVASCDCLILDTASPSRTAGKMVETGFAIAKHKLIYVVGDIIDHAIFLGLADQHFADWDELLAFFAENHKAATTFADQLSSKYLLTPVKSVKK